MTGAAFFVPAAARGRRADPAASGRLRLHGLDAAGLPIAVVLRRLFAPLPFIAALSCLPLAATAVALPASAAAPGGRLRLAVAFHQGGDRCSSPAAAARRFRSLAGARDGAATEVSVRTLPPAISNAAAIELLRTGRIEMLVVPAAAVAAAGAAELDLLELPFLFQDRAGLRAVADGPFGAELLRRVENSGLVGLALWDAGPLAIASRTPLERSDAVRGLAFGGPQSRVFTASITALAAQPRSRLAEGLDAIADAPCAFEPRRLGRLGANVLVSSLSRRLDVVLAHAGFWAGLSPARRAGLLAALADATGFADAQAAQDNERALARLAASGRTAIHRLTADEADGWKRALMPVHRELEQRLGRAWLLAAYRAARFRPPH